MNRKSIFGSMIMLMVFAGCAKKSEEITPTYVSPLQFQSYSCKQIVAEASRVGARSAELTGVQDKKASNDAAATAIALVVFWPAAFFIKGNKETASELARLKGELDALEVSAIEKNCDITFARGAAPENA